MLLNFELADNTCKLAQIQEKIINKQLSRLFILDASWNLSRRKNETSDCDVVTGYFLKMVISPWLVQRS